MRDCPSVRCRHWCQVSRSTTPTPCGPLRPHVSSLFGVYDWADTSHVQSLSIPGVSTFFDVPRYTEHTLHSDEPRPVGPSWHVWHLLFETGFRFGDLLKIGILGQSKGDGTFPTSSLSFQPTRSSGHRSEQVTKTSLQCHEPSKYTYFSYLVTFFFRSSFLLPCVLPSFRPFSFFLFFSFLSSSTREEMKFGYIPTLQVTHRKTHNHRPRHWGMSWELRTTPLRTCFVLMKSGVRHSVTLHLCVSEPEEGRNPRVVSGIPRCLFLTVPFPCSTRTLCKSNPSVEVR